MGPGSHFLGRQKVNPTPLIQEGEAGKCGFVGEIHVAPQSIGGTSGTVNFSTDAKQSCMYVADLVNDVIYVLNRQNLTELARIGGAGHQPGQFHCPHVVATDSDGNVYAGEVGGWRCENSEVPALRCHRLHRHRQRGSGQVLSRRAQIDVDSRQF